MKPESILLAGQDANTARLLAESLQTYFHSVRLAHSLEELKAAIPRYRIEAVVADLETVALDDIAELSRTVPVICTHRVPDEPMWAAALAAGALDVCPSSDANGIVSSLRRNLALTRFTAA
jgi:DNA-binding NtrC family response regulator